MADDKPKPDTSGAKRILNNPQGRHHSTDSHKSAGRPQQGDGKHRKDSK